MTLIRNDLPHSIIASIRKLWCGRAKRLAERRALEIVAAKPHSHLLEDAGLTRDEAEHLTERRRLQEIADWSRWRGRDI